MDKIFTGFVIGLFASLLMLVTICRICDMRLTPNTGDGAIEGHERFIQIQRMTNEGYPMHIWVDTKTMVQYLQISTLGFTVVLDADGKPLLYEEE